MFGDMMGNLEEKQGAMKKKLAEIEMDIASNGGEVTVRINANREILNIAIREDLIKAGDKEQIEDLLTVTINEALLAAAAREAEAAQQMVQDMLPPGFDGLKGLFG